MANGCAIVSCGVLSLAVIITSIVLFAVSWKQLDPVDVAVDYNTNTEKIDWSRLYTSGRYLLGLGHKFIKFRKTVQTVRFSDGGNLPSRTHDGLLITLDASFQYRLKTGLADLRALYENFGLGYLNIIEKMSRDAIRDVASDFSAYDFFANRSMIQTLMQAELIRVLDEQHVSVDSFQLLNVALPTELDAAIQATQISRQAVNEAVFAQRSAQIDADTRVLKAQKDAQVIVLNANATANSIAEQANAQAAAIIASYSAEGAAYSTLQSTLGFSPEETIAYFFSSAIRDGKAQMYVGVNTPSENKLN